LYKDQLRSIETASRKVKEKTRGPSLDSRLAGDEAVESNGKSRAQGTWGQFGRSARAPRQMGDRAKS
jgi:hypothetical protein